MLLDEFMKLKPKIEQKSLADSLGIDGKTLYRWLREIGVEKQARFIELLHIIDICPSEYINEYFNKDYTCPKIKELQQEIKNLRRELKENKKQDN